MSILRFTHGVPKVLRTVGAPVDIQHILQGPDKLGVGVWRGHDAYDGAGWFKGTSFGRDSFPY